MLTVYAPRKEELTKRQKEIIKGLALGLEAKQIALEMETSAQTVKNQLTSIYKRLKVPNNVRAVVACLKNGMLKLEEL